MTMTARVAFVFPGQGSQRTGMLDTLPTLASTHALLDAAERLTGMPLRRIAADGPADVLAQTRAAQPLLYVAGLAWAEALARASVAPAFVAGHSLGELAALAVAGVFPASTGLELVAERARIMGEVAAATPGTMAAVLGVQRDVVADAVANVSGVWLANDNSDGQAVISGTHDGVERATQALHEAGARKIVPLEVAGPFHSPLMEPARQAFAEVLDSVQFTEARIPVLQNTEPSPATDPETIKARLRDQITAPVRWRETVAELQRLGVTVLAETGPGAVLTGLARRVSGLTAVSVETEGIERTLEVAER